ncbi:MAG: type III-B CRISPR module RAMP protein Cmr6, partial [Verrucomicrobiota bacterium]
VEGGGRLDNAARWSVLRIVTGGTDLLKGDAFRLRHEASGRNVQPHIKERKERDAAIAEKMSKVAGQNTALTKVANANAAHFLADLAKSFSGRVVTMEATLAGRLLVNLAGGVVENAGISLDRCFGLPFIPGSAVKGITRAQALWEIRESQEAEKKRMLRFAMLIFGYGANDIKGKGDFAWAGGATATKSVADEMEATDFKGCACFLPAYPTTPPTLVVDMVNPHYPDYYQGRRPRAEDNESPVPNYFPAVEADASFGFAVLLNRVPCVDEISADDLLDQVRQWMERAVTLKGIGAKTAAGYGWFELGRGTSSSSPNPATGGALAPTTPAEACIANWRGKLTTSGNFIKALPELATLADDAGLKVAFESIIPEAERRRLRKNNPYWQSFTSGRHGEAGKKILARLSIQLS